MKRDLTYYRTRKEPSSFGVSYVPYPYDGPLTYTVAKEAINNMAGQGFKVWHCKRTNAPKSLTEHHQDALRHTQDALANLYGRHVSDRLYAAAMRVLGNRLNEEGYRFD